MKTQIIRANHDNFQIIAHYGVTTEFRSIINHDYKKVTKLFIQLFTVFLILCSLLEGERVFAQEKSPVTTASQPLDLSALDGISAKSEKVPSTPSHSLEGTENSTGSLPSDGQVKTSSAEGAGSVATASGTVTASGNSSKTQAGSNSQNSVTPSAQNSQTGSSTGDAHAAGSIDPTVTAPKSKFWELVKAGGFIGVILLVLSLIACTIVIQFCLTLRRSCLYPLSFAEEVKRLIDQGKYRFAHQLCGNSDTLLGQVLYKGFSEYQGDWAPVEKALEEAVEEESASLYRKSEMLSVIGNIAPMLGLLGTVIGMVVAFGELASSDGLGRNLAQGIYFALVTTVDGLIVAIPALVTYSIINNIIASRISEMTDLIDQITRPMKKVTGNNNPIPAPSIGRSAQVPPFPPVNR